MDQQHQDNNDTYSDDNDYVSLVRIPRKWYSVFAWTFSVLVIGHTIADVGFGWGWKALGDTPASRMAMLMTFIVGWFFISSHLLEEIMLGYAKRFKNKIFAAGKAVGIAEGKTEGIAEGIIQGKTEGIAEGIIQGKTEGIAEGMTRGKKELFDELREAQRRGIPLEEALENYEAENGNIVRESADNNEK